jgi:dolichyl-diphosphooligosaccharide--protein glycosyltransferase
MVAAWGGYTFVLNMVGLHAAILVPFGKFCPSVHKAYSLFWIVGTLGAVQFPVVGLAPIKSLEQLGPAFVFVGYQVLAVTELLVAKRNATGHQKWRLRLRCYAVAGVCLLSVIAVLAPTGWFGPLSVRVRGLFIKHTKTGNPLVDSVAEHQPGTPDAYQRYLNLPYYVAPVGFVISCGHFLKTKSAAALFLPLYGVVAYYFANRMVRLIIFLGPIASSLSGVAVGFLSEQIFGNLVWFANGGGALDDDANEKSDDADSKKPFTKKNGKVRKSGTGKSAGDGDTAALLASIRASVAVPLSKFYDSKQTRVSRVLLAAFLLITGLQRVPSFVEYSHEIAKGMSQPSVMFKGQLNDGRTIIVKDYVEAYHWLRDNTPEDARVMAWWDYGYQIAGIANRTSIADGNTWNHKHIANLARTMTATEEKAHRVIRHLADYVLVWSGGGADDMAKSPHLFRIGKSIGHDTGTVDMHEIQSKFGVDQYGRPTPLMAQSLLYKLVSFQGAVAKERFEEVYTSKYRKVRIYKVVNVSDKSKQWAADPANRLCDAPGSWYCPGQYPPALAKFSQIIKPAYNMPAFAKKQTEERAAREAKAETDTGAEL